MWSNGMTFHLHLVLQWFEKVRRSIRRFSRIFLLFLYSGPEILQILVSGSMAGDLKNKCLGEIKETSDL